MGTLARGGEAGEFKKYKKEVARGTRAVEKGAPDICHTGVS
jgi:hypothetical protein